MHDTEIYQAMSGRRIQAAMVCADNELREFIQSAWTAQQVDWTFFSTGREAAGALLANPPGIIICSAQLPDMPGLQLASMFKEENVYSQVPVILLFAEEQAREMTDWTNFEADDFLIFPCPAFLIKARLEMAFTRASRTLDANPLTRLPGNTSIIRRTQGLIDQCQDFALAYCDLDHFKSFNDKYGFSRGDEVLMMTSRILLNSLKSMHPPFSFVGHVGGDDFVFILPVDMAEDACKKVLAAFDGIVPHFYDEDDRQRGGIVSTDRQGVLRAFPLMALSIAVVFNRNGSLQHYGEASQRAMNLKKKAKEDPLSNYVLDRRTESSKERSVHEQN